MNKRVIVTLMVFAVINMQSALHCSETRRLPQNEGTQKSQEEAIRASTDPYGLILGFNRRVNTRHNEVKQTVSKDDKKKPTSLRSRL